MSLKRTLGIVFALAAAVVITLWIFNKHRDSSSSESANPNLKIGAILALTGPNSAYGINARLGLELAQQDIQAAHPGHAVEIKYEDSQSTPAKAITSYQQLIATDDYKIIFGNASFLAKAISPLAEKDQILFVALGTTMPGLVEGKKNVIRHFPVAKNLASVVADYAKSKFSRVAVLYVDDEYGLSASKSFAEQFTSSKNEIVFHEAFPPTATDFKTLVDKALEAKPDAIYVPGYGAAFSAIITRVREVSPKLPILGDLALVNSNVRSALGSNAEGIVVPALPTDAGMANSERAKQFISRFREQHNENPDILTVTSYDALWIVFDAFTASGNSPEAIKKFIVEKGPHNTLNGPVEYSKDGDSLISPVLLVVKDGKLVALSP